MSTILDSEATFIHRAKEAGLTQPWIDALKTESLATFAKLSFAVTTPGVPASDAQVVNFLGTLRGGVNATIAEQSAFKRILFEAQTLMIHNLKSSIKGDDAAIQKMAPQEREARLKNLRDELKGIDISGPLEPAHSVYDLCADMIEKNQIVYLSPSKCLSRQQELLGAKPEKELQLDATKTGLVVKEQASNTEITLSSDLALHQAIQRRNIAVALTQLVSFDVIRKWTDRLFAMYAQVPAGGFHKISQAQLLRADRQAFISMAEAFTGSLRDNSGPDKPLDSLVAKLETDVTVTYHMLPVPVVNSVAAFVGNKTDSDKASASGAKRKMQAGNSVDPPPKAQFVRKGGKSSGKSKQRRDPMPQGLQGMHSRTPKGEPICFSYNLGTCKLGDKCTRRHVCMVPGCYKNHPQIEHQ